MFKMICSASVMCADLLHLEDDILALEAAGCDELHFDIMDGLFVPNFTLGFDLIKAVKRCAKIPCSAHLMIARPGDYVKRFIEAGCNSVTVHAETSVHCQRLLTQIRALEASPGIAINPATPLTKLDYLLDYVDRVLVMAVDPGYAGQTLIRSAYERVKLLKEVIDYRKLNVRIEVDGNINAHNAALLSRAGAEIFVLGSSSLFTGANDPGNALRAFKSAVAQERQLV